MRSHCDDKVAMAPQRRRLVRRTERAKMQSMGNALRLAFADLKRLGQSCVVLACTTTIAADVSALSPPLVPATKVLATMQTRYAGTASLRAQFVERQYLSDPLHIETAPPQTLPPPLIGRLTFVRPNLIGWSYDNGDKVVSDGTQIAIYSLAASSVLIENVEPSPYVAPLFFFGGINVGSIPFQAQATHWLGLRRPGPSTTVYGHPAFRVPNFLGELFAIDATGDVGVFGTIDGRHVRHDFELTGAIENTSIDPADFVLELPAKVTRIGPASPLVRLAKAIVGKK